MEKSLPYLLRNNNIITVTFTIGMQLKISNVTYFPVNYVSQTYCIIYIIILEETFCWFLYDNVCTYVRERNGFAKARP